MTNNPTVKRFKTDMKDLANQMKYNFHEVVLKQADELIENMLQVVPRDTGKLSKSLRKKDVSRITIGQAQVSVLVLGGGYITTKRTESGHSFDYAFATEFGTEKEAPEPFFYNTARLYHQNGLDLFRETLDDTIKENNQIRASRSDNAGLSSDFTHNVSAGTQSYRGATVSAKK